MYPLKKSVQKRLCRIFFTGHCRAGSRKRERFPESRTKLIRKGFQGMDYPENTVYLVGHAKVASDNPISLSYGIFFLPFVVDRDTHKIVDVSCNAILDISQNFVRSMLVGCDLLDGLDEAIRRVRTRYFGSSQKALVAALRDANGRLRDILSAQ